MISTKPLKIVSNNSEDPLLFGWEMGSFPTEANSFSDSMNRSDQALYKAKRREETEWLSQMKTNNFTKK
ncbi:hypothetical protein BBV17_18485 [Cytobacillus oceanisediminis]|jgi:hypothetical protein|uniref:Uncharacterized protein n=1 Tax=Cytobacillus oceanisediminis TaxID=665099 RepID=A0ABX3CS56_9BACI|nr:hypothetical protein BBV17_18485 [Cytobacillus oceanisediminis]